MEQLVMGLYLKLTSRQTICGLFATLSVFSKVKTVLSSHYIDVLVIWLLLNKRVLKGVKYLVLLF